MVHGGCGGQLFLEEPSPSDWSDPTLPNNEKCDPCPVMTPLRMTETCDRRQMGRIIELGNTSLTLQNYLYIFSNEWIMTVLSIPNNTDESRFIQGV